MIGIYQIRCIINDHRYIGSSRSIEHRWYRHCWHLERGTHANYRLQNDWSKHTVINFEFTILEKCAMKELVIREQFYLDNHNPEYNICPIAGSRRGHKCSDLTKARIGKASKGRVFSAASRRRMSEKRIGHMHNLELRKLTDDEVREIRGSHMPCLDLAKKFGVTEMAVSRVKRGLTYKNVF